MVIDGRMGMASSRFNIYSSPLATEKEENEVALHLRRCHSMCRIFILSNISNTGMAPVLTVRYY